MQTLSDEQYLRYGRQLLLPEWGEAGQLRLANKTVLVVGLGGLGCPAVQYLAGAGIGCLLLADGDKVSLSNLPRQTLYQPQQVTEPKALMAQQWVAQHNPNVRTVALERFINGAILRQLLAGQHGHIDLVLDCTDNFTARHQLSHGCRAAKVPLISAAAVGWQGQLLPILADGPCFHCLSGGDEVQAQSCREVGVAGPVLGTVASMQVLLALRLLLQLEVPPLLHRFDGRTLRWQGLRLSADPRCPSCGSAEQQE
ncbi:HesA/MoeB/ThiF family protein [uncultured Ferrimonas sp.]|uniref:HesA/MoeB/ThiF family protein n=1 Tax=uncultured Ferrimonas sp. TaxID=432640 RepID=UPI002631B678|nr:HesA/MoeB/ThiF family protein [uncultured Ferrimonas sp.]